MTATSIGKSNDLAFANLNNTIEGFWGQLKRSIFGIYHFVSGEYLQRYVDEAVFRYNTREMNGADVFETLFNRAVDGYLYYEDVLMVA